MTSLARSANAEATAGDRTGLTSDEFWGAQEATLVAAMQSGRYPHMAALDDDVFAGSHEETFDFGIQWILDGVDALVQARRASRSE